MQLNMIGNPRSFLPAGSAKNFEQARDFSRLNGLSAKAAIQKLVRESLDDERASLKSFEAEILK